MTNSSANKDRSLVSSTIAAGLAAIGASLCCIGPLVLIALGIGGTWVSYLTVLEPYRPLFVGITLVFIFLAFRKLYIIPQQCLPEDACTIPTVLRNQRIIFWFVTALLIALLTFPYYGLIFFE